MLNYSNSDESGKRQLVTSTSTDTKGESPWQVKTLDFDKSDGYKKDNIDSLAINRDSLSDGKRSEESLHSGRPIPMSTAYFKGISENCKEDQNTLLSDIDLTKNDFKEVVTSQESFGGDQRNRPFKLILSQKRY
jgi:hypothetical protein